MYVQKNILRKKQFLVDMICENGHKKTLLETLVKDYNSKKKNNDNHNYISSKKILWVPKMDQNLGKNQER